MSLRKVLLCVFLFTLAGNGGASSGIRVNEDQSASPLLLYRTSVQTHHKNVVLINPSSHYPISNRIATCNMIHSSQRISVAMDLEKMTSAHAI
jgi:hypothetical protein